MSLLKNVLREACGFRAAMGCALITASIFLTFLGTAGAAAKPMTVAELALYQGLDREKLLIEGAKKEGQLTIYDSHTGIKTVVQEFEKKYPFIKCAEWRSDSPPLLQKVTEEYSAGRFLVDAIEVTAPVISILHREGILQEYYSPHLVSYGDEYKKKGKTGVFYLADREIYIGLGFNTERVPPAEAPKSLKDLLDPRWKGKMSLVSSSTGVRWIGNALEAMGRDFIEKLSRQDVRVQNISGAALAGLVASGEVPLSPSIFRDNIYMAKKKGAPVEWRPLEPVVTNVGFSGMTTKSPHPCAALLFLDYLQSKEGQQVVMKSGPNSPRRDMGSLETEFKKTIFDTKYTQEEFEKKFANWDNLLKKLFIIKGSRS